MKSLIRFSLAALLALPLAAQDSGFTVGAGLMLPLDSLKKATNGGISASLQADYRTTLPGTEVATRVGLGLVAMPGQDRNGLKTSLNLAQAYGDLVLDLPAASLRGIVGLSLNSYTMSTTGTESLDPEDVAHHFPVRDAKGLKLGLRLGLTYAFSRQVAGELLFQQTELSGKDLADPLVRVGGINPAWLQLGVRYSF